MSKTLINSTVILNETLSILRTKCKALQAVNRDYDDRFGNKVALKPGTTLYARKPIQVGIRTGKKRDAQDTVEESVAISCSDQLGVDLPAFTSEQITMNVDDFSNRYLKPTASRIAAEIDRLVLQHAAESFYQYVGTPGTTPATAAVVLQAGQKIEEMNGPEEDRYGIIQPAANTALVDAFKGLYSPSGQIGEQFNTGYLRSSLGLDIASSNNLHRITNGTRVGTTLVDQATFAEGMSAVTVDGFTNATDTVSKGEKFTMAGVYSVTPETKINTGSLQQFTVTADFTASGNEGEISFSPAIRSTGARQNVTALPLENAAVTFASGTASTSYPHNIVMHKDAMTFVTADLPLPKGVHEAKRDILDGISMRYITYYDGTNDEFSSRFDIFYGISSLRPELGIVMFG